MGVLLQWLRTESSPRSRPTSASTPNLWPWLPTHAGQPDHALRRHRPQIPLMPGLPQHNAGPTPPAHRRPPTRPAHNETSGQTPRRQSRLIAPRPRETTSPHLVHPRHRDHCAGLSDGGHTHDHASFNCASWDHRHCRARWYLIIHHQHDSPLCRTTRQHVWGQSWGRILLEISDGIRQ